MNDNHDRPHPDAISRRDALGGVLLGALGLAPPSRHGDAAEPVGRPHAADAFVPENDYPTFADEVDDRRPRRA